MASDKIKIALEQDTNARPIEISVLQDDCPVISATVLTGYSSDVPGDILERIEAVEYAVTTLTGRVDNLETCCEDLTQKVATNTENIASNTTAIQNNTQQIESNTTAISSNAGAIAQNASDIADIKAQQAQDKADLTQLQSDVAGNTGAINALESEVSDIQELIPAQANAENPLADKNFVNSTVQTSTANFRGNWPTFADVPSIATAYPVDYAGSTTPTTNDYLVVETDENYNGETWRYKYVGDWATQGKSGWRAEYKVNDTPLTADQLAAINSGITQDAVAQIDTNRHDISDCKGDIAALEADKQDKLTAGENITIENGVISAAGGSSLPDQAGHTGYLMTDGENATWSDKEPLTNNASDQFSTAIGDTATANGSSATAIGRGAKANYNFSLSVGGLAAASGEGAIAIGYYAQSIVPGAIMIGENGIARKRNTFNVALNKITYTVLNEDGTIPSERLAADGTAGQVLSKTEDGMQWVDMGGGGGGADLPAMSDDTAGKYLTNENGEAKWSAQKMFPFSFEGNALGIGTSAQSTLFGVAIGTNATASESASVALGVNARATKYQTVALGGYAQATAICAIQIGEGTNNEASTLYVGFARPDRINYKLLNGDGLVPSARFANEGEDGQVLVKNGDYAEWADAPGGGVSYDELQQVQTELQNAIDTKADASAITDMLTKTAAAGIYQTQAVATATDNAQDEKITANTSAISALTGRMAANETNITTLTSNVGNVQGLIPTQASDTNQLADKAFVNSTIQTATANFRGNWATHADIPADVSSYPEDYAGSRTPTVNDYLVVEADETHDGATWRYKYTGNWADQGVSGWVAEYKVNDTPLTAAQLAAVNSGITSEYVGQIDTNRNDISEALGQIAALDTDKQDKLTAGTGIGISDANVVAVENPLPTLTGNSGFLTTDGTTASWSGVAAATKADISDMLTRTNAAQIYVTQANAKSTYVNTVQYEQTQNAVTALQNDKQDKLTPGDNITIENSTISVDEAQISNLAMPATTAGTDLTFTTSGSRYTAPSDGWFVIQLTTSASTLRFLNLFNRSAAGTGTSQGLGNSLSVSTSGTTLTNHMIAKKGQVVEVQTNETNAPNYFKFVPSTGANA